MNLSSQKPSDFFRSAVRVQELPQEMGQGSLFSAIDERFEGEATRKERAELALLISQQSRYPAAPAVIRRAWEALVPAIVELSYHQTHDGLNLVQSVRKTRNLKGTGNRATDGSQFRFKPEVLDEWMLDLLVLVGTMPVDKGDATERCADAGTARLARSVEGLDDGGISAQGRAEAMMCLELLCAKAWYARNIERRDQLQTMAMLFKAMQYMYWECGIPTSLSMLWDHPPAVTDKVYDEVRRFNYRQLYAIEKADMLPKLLERVRLGIEALKERRAYFLSRFALALSRDPRWNRSFSEHYEIIASKYPSASDEEEGDDKYASEQAESQEA